MYTYILYMYIHIYIYIYTHTMSLAQVASVTFRTSMGVMGHHGHQVAGLKLGNWAYSRRVWKWMGIHTYITKYVYVFICIYILLYYIISYHIISCDII